MDSHSSNSDPEIPKKSYKIYSDVMADLDSKNMHRPQTATTVDREPLDKETKRNKSKGNNNFANFQIY